MNRNIALFITMVFALFSFSIWTLVKFNDTYNMLTKHTQLSAWALAQLEFETLLLHKEVDKYVLDENASKTELNLKYDILWSRYSTFLSSDETASIRVEHQSGEVVTEAFHLVKKYEHAVVIGDRARLAAFSAELEALTPQLRGLMVTNFTGEASVKEREVIAESRKTVLTDMFLILLVLSLLSYRLYKDSQKQTYIAWHDPLTKLKNRNFLLNELKELSEKDQKYAIVLLDISHFKEINDTVSYEYGDQVLIEISQHIKAKADKFSFSCARVGADEFAILINQEDFHLEFFVKKLLSDLNSALHSMDRSGRMSISMGIATYTESGDSNEHLLKKSNLVLNNADFALNIAKKSNTEQVVYFSKEIEIEHRKKHKLSEELELLISIKEQKQLFMVFQPIVSRNTNKMGCEALIRWQHPLYGFINPEYLISIAEESGLAKDLGKWIMKEVHHALAVDWSEFNDQVEIAINLSDSLFDEELPALVTEVFGGNPNYLDSIVLEITETMTLDEVERSSNIINELEKIGVRLALDDFGTGWSSLYNLNHLRFNKLKIDKSFIQNLNCEKNQTFFVSAIVNLSHQLGIKVVAEGVEDVTQLKSLIELGVDEFQGYYFSKPVSKQEFTHFCKHYFDKDPLAANMII